MTHPLTGTTVEYIGSMWKIEGYVKDTWESGRLYLRHLGTGVRISLLVITVEYLAKSPGYRAQ